MIAAAAASFTHMLHNFLFLFLFFCIIWLEREAGDKIPASHVLGSGICLGREALQHKYRGGSPTAFWQNL